MAQEPRVAASTGAATARGGIAGCARRRARRLTLARPPPGCRRRRSRRPAVLMITVFFLVPLG